MKLTKKILALGLSLSIVIASAPHSNALSFIGTVGGGSSYQTAGAIADKQTYSTAILVNLDASIADGLSASGLAGTLNAPILLSHTGKLPIETSQRLTNVKKVYIIGGLNSVNQQVENTIKARGIQVVRIQGANRTDTSVKVANEIKSLNGLKTVMFTNGFKGDADAITVASVAVRDKAAIILTDGTNVNFDASSTKNYVIGGNASVGEVLVEKTNATRLGGANRFETNKKLINHFYPGVKEFHISKAHYLTDALTGSTITKNAPTVLVDRNSDKSILSGATKVTLIGNLDQETLNLCLNAANGVKPPSAVDEYTNADFYAELNFVLTYLDYMEAVSSYGDPSAIAYAKDVQPIVDSVYNDHLKIKSNSPLYHAMTNVLSNLVNLNKAIARYDLPAVKTWIGKLNQSLGKVQGLMPRNSRTTFDIPELSVDFIFGNSDSNKTLDKKVIDEKVNDLELIANTIK